MKCRIVNENEQIQRLERVGQQELEENIELEEHQQNSNGQSQQITVLHYDQTNNLKGRQSLFYFFLYL
jgi:hypothetical protein